MASTLQTAANGPTPQPGDSSPGWVARLHLRYARRGQATRLVDRSHRGPLVVQKALYPEGEATCHTYLVHPPGGIVGGDELHLRIHAEDEAHALLTTPSATRIYRSIGARSVIDQHLDVETGAIVEWLPQEIIAFDGSRVDMGTRVRLERGATFIGWEILVLGRPAAGAPFRTGDLVQTLQIERAGVPSLRERLELSGDSEALEAPWGLAGRRVIGTLVAVGPRPIDEAVLGSVREGLSRGPALAGATSMSGFLVIRVLAERARGVMTGLVGTWRLVRPTLVGRIARPPRIWST